MKLPEGWKEVELGNIFTFQKKSTIKAGEGLSKGKYKFFTSSDKQSKYIDKHNQDGEFLIFATGGHAGIHYCNEKFATSTDCFIAKVDDKIMAKYVYYYLFSRIQLLEDGFKGAGLKHISKGYIEDMKIIYPENKKTQKEIISILDKIVETSEWREKSDDLTNDFLNIIFVDIFGDIQTNSKKWDEVKLTDVVESIVDIGSNGSNAVIAKNLDMSNTENYAMMVRTVNFTANDFVNNVKYVSEKAYNFFKKSKIFGGEIIMNKIGSAGKIWMMPYLNRPVSLGLNQLAIKGKNIEQIYLFWYLENDFIKHEIQRMVGGAVTKSITKTALRELKVLLPPKDSQKKFASIVKEIEAMKEQQKHSKNHIDKLFNALMQKAFKGELII